ncbi:NAD-dependent epimerase/dehydratase family protein [soil metagenome]
MKIFITGGAGFIGSQMAEKFLSLGHAVTCFDNLILGRREFVPKDATFIEEDLLNLDRVVTAMKGHDLVVHLAANSDISQGVEKSDVDLRNGTIATFNTLEAMRKSGVRDLLFASTSAIYGEASVKPTPESYGPLFPISFYGASKLGCEGLVSAFAHNCALRAVVFRFANIVGPRSTHGAIHDFTGRLLKDASVLKVLGNGTQQKSYLHVEDCIDGMLFAWDQFLSTPSVGEKFECFNLASHGVSNVKFLASTVVKEFAIARGLKEIPKLEFGESDRGWVGDVAFTWLDGSRLEKLGWKARFESNGAVEKAVREIIAEKIIGAVAT